jgi:hypothetical protein
MWGFGLASGPSRADISTRATISSRRDDGARQKSKFVALGGIVTIASAVEVATRIGLRAISP